MKKIVALTVLFFFAIICAQGQTVIGKWKTIDDETGKPKSIVEIYEESGKIYGKVVEILDEEHKNSVCSECTGEDRSKPILGMIVIKGLSKVGNEYKKGKILDPKNGKTYQCFITLEGDNKLKVRGYIGISLLGRTQYWYRADVAK
jgi:uncharacterized protein (DUF2147 family)